MAIATRLVDLYRSEGRYSEAEELCVEILGANDRGEFGIAQSRLQVCLADLYQRQGRYIAAEQAYRVAVAQRRRIFGDRHPKTVQILPRLAVVCRLLGRPDEAEALTRTADAAFDAFEYARAAGHA